MDQTQIAEEMMKTVDNMIDPSATLEQQLAQMQEQIAALSQLPNIIQQKLEAVNRHISQISHISQMNFKEVHQEKNLEVQNTEEDSTNQFEKQPEDTTHSVEITEIEPEKETVGENEAKVEIRVTKPSLTEEELAIEDDEVKRMLESKIEENTHNEETVHDINIEHQVATPPRKPSPVFGPAPPERYLVLSRGRKYKKTLEYNEELIQETLTAQAEVIKGNAIGVNFMKYEKPPMVLDHLKNSEVFKAIHNMNGSPIIKVGLRKPAIAEVDYRERARSMSPGPNGR